MTFAIDRKIILSKITQHCKMSSFYLVIQCAWSSTVDDVDWINAKNVFLAQSKGRRERERERKRKGREKGKGKLEVKLWQIM